MRGKLLQLLIFGILLIFQLSVCLATETSDANDSSKYLNAVREFADNVLKYGRDTYGPKHTPLFVDGLNVHTREPVKWRYNGQVWILSDLACQQNLFRTLDGLTEITSNPKYRQAAVEAIRYAFANLRSPNGLLHWGGHVAYDAQRDNMCTGQYVHELKFHFPYYGLMWQVNPKATKQFIESFWAAHIMDWSNLVMNRHGSMTRRVENPWRHEYKGGPVFFYSKGLSFLNTGSDLIYAAAWLTRLSGDKEPLVWAKRLAYRYVETRNPKTGIGGSQYTRLKMDRAELQFGDDLKGHLVLEGTLFPGGLRHSADLAGQMRTPICQILLADLLGAQGKEFHRWVLDELTAWGKVAYRKKDNSFIPMLTDGTRLEGYIYTKDGYFGPKGTVVKPMRGPLIAFWAYAMAFRLTGDSFMWDMARSIVQGNNLGDLGDGRADQPMLQNDTDCSHPYALLGFLELYRKTGKKPFLHIAKTIGDNILADTFRQGFFVPSKKVLYTKFDYVEPLVLLHLDIVLKGKPSLVPQVWPSRSFFACPYEAYERGEDTIVIYSRTQATDLTRLLHEAAWDGKIGEVESLLSKGADVNAGAKVDSPTIQRILGMSSALDTGLRATLSWATTALHYACEKGHKDVAELLIAKDADVNAGDNSNKKPLHYAVEKGHKEIAELLIANGADVNAKDKQGRTPIDLAMEQGQREMAKLLLSNGGDVSIHTAAYIGDLQRVEKFIDDGENVDAKDQEGQTALHYAAKVGEIAVAEFLIAHGANVNAGEGYWIPLQEAAYYSKEMVELLIARGANINEGGWSALHSALDAGRFDIVELLLAKGADANIRDDKGRTPLHIAAWYAASKNPKIVELLLSKGADINAKDNNGKTALSYATENGHTEIVELLRKRPPAGACLFDGVIISLSDPREEGFQVRDVAANSDFVRFEHGAMGLELKHRKEQTDSATFFDVTISDTTGKDRAITLVYTVPLSPEGCHWLQDPRRSLAVKPGREYIDARRFSVGANGKLSRYPFAAVATADQGVGLGIDMGRPAFFRVGYNAGTKELFLAYDIGLAPEKPTAHVRFCKFAFDPKWGFRAALARYYKIFPDCFRCRTDEQGLWMPFAKISDVNDWQDFGFKFKEGNNETGWDDEHNIITFRYTEPMTWWMRMPKEMPRTLQAALGHARHLAEEKLDPRAKAFFTSGCHDEAGQFSARLLNRPWCDGAVWSINSMPGVQGEITDFKNKWNEKLREELYGAKRRADLDGEYIDSSEGYVTDELNFRRDHFAAAQTPLAFSLEGCKVGIFRGLTAFEYVRAISGNIHSMNKLMMANSTPIRLCWLAPELDVMGTETNWNPGGTWRPMSDSDLLYRRALCKGKPYCFLMNTHFEEFSHELVEKYMKRCLAYGMFPGFFSHNASQGHYFRRPELYERDRDLFKKYVPLCKLVAEADWEPITRARSSDEHVYVERFGDRFFTVFNDSTERRTVIIKLERNTPKAARELVHGQSIKWRDQQTDLTLDGEDVAVIEIN